MSSNDKTDLVFHVSGLLQESVGATRAYEIQQVLLRLDDETDASNLHRTVRLLRIHRGILVEGEVSAEVKLQCSRCLAPVTTRVSASLQEEFRPSVDIFTGAPAPTGPDDEFDDDYFQIGSEHVLDLNEAVRQAILVELPYSPVCREGCAGICAQCGADLNVENCGCVRNRADVRLAGLAALLDGNEDERTVI